MNRVPPRPPVTERMFYRLLTRTCHVFSLPCGYGWKSMGIAYPG